MALVALVFFWFESISRSERHVYYPSASGGVVISRRHQMVRESLVAWAGETEQSELTNAPTHVLHGGRPDKFMIGY